MFGSQKEYYIIDNIIDRTYQEVILNYTKYKLPFYITEPIDTIDYKEFYDQEKWENLIDKSGFKDKIYDASQQSHVLYRNNNPSGVFEYSHIFTSIIYEFQKYVGFSFIYDIIRYKINFQQKQNFTDPSLFNPPHTDLDEAENMWTLIYYINNSDGDTILFNEHYNRLNFPTSLTIQKEISPQMGRLIAFPTSKIHSGRFPIHNSHRIVANINIQIHSPK